MGLGQRAFSHLANAILSTPGKLLVLASAAALLGGGVYGTTQLQQVLIDHIQNGDTFDGDTFDTILNDSFNGDTWAGV